MSERNDLHACLAAYVMVALDDELGGSKQSVILQRLQADLCAMFGLEIARAPLARAFGRCAAFGKLVEKQQMVCELTDQKLDFARMVRDFISDEIACNCTDIDCRNYLVRLTSPQNLGYSKPSRQHEIWKELKRRLRVKGQTDF
ncbi:MAG: hypothetical protein KC609_06925 [Myxococcales bacterium]|nr:hypothetical protein [Myxococcales bacterium]